MCLLFQVQLQGRPQSPSDTTISWAFPLLKFCSNSIVHSSGGMVIRRSSQSVPLTFQKACLLTISLIPIMSWEHCSAVSIPIWTLGARSSGSLIPSLVIFAVVNSSVCLEMGPLLHVWLQRPQFLFLCFNFPFVFFMKRPSGTSFEEQVMPAHSGSCWNNERSTQLIWFEQCQHPREVVWWKNGRLWGQAGLYSCLDLPPTSCHLPAGWSKVHGSPTC